MVIVTIFILLFLFQLKHFVADYPLQTTYMLGKFEPGVGFVLPLFLHVSVHAALTFSIVLLFASWPVAVLMAILDHTVHFAMDRLKASPKMLGKYKALTGKEFATATDEQKKGNKYFWWALGFDQMVHHYTHYVIILVTVGLS